MLLVVLLVLLMAGQGGGCGSMSGGQSEQSNAWNFDGTLCSTLSSLSTKNIIIPPFLLRPLLWTQNNQVDLAVGNHGTFGIQEAQT